MALAGNAADKRCLLMVSLRKMCATQGLRGQREVDGYSKLLG